MNISVIIPVYNGEKFLAAAIESVLTQQEWVHEIVLIDDGSTDTSAHIAQSFGQIVRYHYQPNQGLSAALNKGIALSKNEILAFLDADDLFPPNKLALQTTLLQQQPEALLAMGKTQYFFEEGAERNILYFPDDSYQVYHNFVGSGLYRRAVFEQVGLFDLSLRSGMDNDWFLRMAEQKIPVASTHEVTLLYRRHQQNMTNEIDFTRKSMLMSFKKSLDRRRQSGEVQPNDLFKRIQPS